MAAIDSAALPADFLTTPPRYISVSCLDFDSAGLQEHSGRYAIILDNVLSPEECDTLIIAAEQSSPQGWERALINIGGGKQALIEQERNCGRIIWDSQEVATRIWNRFAHIPEVQQITTLENVPHIFGNGPAKRGEVWKFTRPNERMRFLKYTGGEYFRPHTDGSYETTDRKERSYFTLHLYLNNASVLTAKEVDSMSIEEARACKSLLVGGATRFHGQSYNPNRKLDVLPEAGRILLFQHRDLPHSGDDVVYGVKYTMRTDLMYTLESTESADRSYMPVL